MSKKTIVIFGVVASIGILLFAVINYCVDPYYYYGFRSGAIRELPNYDEEINQRMLSVYNLKNSPLGTYDGLIIGGSKSWPISSELIKHYTGYTCLHCGVVNGNFDWYEGIIKYAIKHQKIKYVLLHLSGCECYMDYSSSNEARRMPTLLSSDNDWADVVHFLFIDFRATIKHLGRRVKRALLGRNERNDDMRNVIGTYIGTFQNDNNCNSWINEARLHTASQRFLRDYYRTMASGKMDSYAYAKKYTLDFEISYTNKLEKLFTEHPLLPNLTRNLEALTRINRFCQDNDIELKVVIGAVSMPERYKYEGYEYWEFLKGLSGVVDFYDFSYFCDINDNPLNYWNERHNIDTISWLIVCSIYGYNPYNYGRYVTRDNFNSYILDRQRDYFKREEEFRRTGTLKLPGRGTDSDMSRLPKVFFDGIDFRK